MKLLQKAVLGTMAIGLASASWAQIAVPVDAGGVIGDATSTPTTSKFFFTVTTPGAVTDVDIQIAIDHADVFDLYARLYSPSGGYVDLWQGLVVQTPPVYTQIKDTLIDDSAPAGPIGVGANAGAAQPWDGTSGSGFQPQFYSSPGPPHARLSEFNGTPAAGKWELWIVDNVSGGTGTLFAPGGTASWGTTQGTQLLLTVPEPSDFALLAGLGLVGFAAWRRKRSK